ncbi:hypothetical protein SDC9_80869 [bioreactor metagenome]|uniref:Uncharacterized protein n=1 Tax=bioreactor metagenome TaxID=1076179 RepID=A0A644Z0Y5_9ZZZZ
MEIWAFVGIHGHQQVAERMVVAARFLILEAVQFLGGTISSHFSSRVVGLLWPLVDSKGDPVALGDDELNQEMKVRT